ncbi:MAG: tetratricopeptide repeat protein [Ignavibacteriae bacterium]|nr:tetratricopeptide repeat protein [Ignavibacteriota bacterium]
MRQLAVIFLVFLSHVLLAQEAERQFEQANQLYRSGEYQKAAALYEQIILNGYEDPTLYYNLANAYFKLKSIPAAILNYERSFRLSPNDDDISYNLRLANLHVVDKIESIPRLFFIDWWWAFINIFSSDEWVIVGIISLWSAVLAGGIYLVIRPVLLRRISFVVSSLAVLVCLVSFVGAYQRIHRERSENSAIVFSPSVSVKSSPDEQSTDLFVLHEGVKVELVDTIGEWKKIRLTDGKIGWVEQEHLQVI